MKALMFKMAQETIWQEARRSAADELHNTYKGHKGKMNTLRAIGGSAKGAAMMGAGMAALHGAMDGHDQGLKGKHLLKHVARRALIGGTTGAVGGAAGGVGQAIVGHTIGRGVDAVRGRKK